MYRTLLITDGLLDDKLLKLACSAGIEAILIRPRKGLSFYDFARKTRHLTHHYRVQLFVQERVDIALAIHADGVQISENTFSPFAIKKLAPQLIVGVTVHSLKAALKAEKEGADCLHFGPIFEIPQGLNRLSEVSMGVKIPVIAVGGITPMRAHNCVNAKAFGVGAKNAFLQGDIEQTVRAFKTAFPTEKKKLSGLHVILNADETHLATSVMEGGVQAIHFRNEGPYSKEMMKRGENLSLLCQMRGIEFIVHDRMDVALALNATGLHLGKSDVPLHVARRILGRKKIVGISTSTLRQAEQAELEGANYVCFGQKNLLGNLERLITARKKIEIPFFASGGITQENAQKILESGVDGILVMSAITQAKDPLLATKNLFFNNCK